MPVHHQVPAPVTFVNRNQERKSSSGMMQSCILDLLLRWYKEDCSHRGHNSQGAVRWENVTPYSLERAKEPKHKKIGQKGKKRPWDKQHPTAVMIKVSLGLICIIC